jgi:ribosomal protein S18 acetylase RimI-like enzyme
MPVTGNATVRRGGIGDLAALAPLWVSVHQRHAEVMPELAPYVTDERTWEVRSALYRELLARPTSVLLLAEDGGTAVGYGLAYLMEPGERAWLDDTWSVPGPVGEIESLAVLPSHRGRGLGTRLLAGLEAALLTAGATDLVLGVLPGNAAAVRLYGRHGYLPTWTYLSKLHGRPAPR